MSPYLAWKGPSGGLVPLVGYSGGTTRITPLHQVSGSVDVRAVSGTWGYTNVSGLFTSTDTVFAAVNTVNDTFTAHIFDLAVPQGATITEARFTAYARGTLNWASVNNMALGAEQVDDATPMTTETRVARVANIGTTVVWNPTGGIGSIAAPNPIAGADITSVVQAIVDRPGWVSGQAIHIVTHTPGSNPVNYSWHGPLHATEAWQPRLEVAFTSGTFSGSVTGLSATAGVGTTTLSWSESSSPDSVGIYRDGALFDTVSGGVLTWTSGVMNDGLYTWTLVPVKGGLSGATSSPLVFGNMTADVYIDTVSGLDTNSGTTPALAVKTINKAGTLVTTAGTTVCIRGGTYAEYNALRNGGSTAPLTTFTVAGTAVDRNYFLTFPGETVVLDGSGIVRDVDFSNSNMRDPQLLHFSGNYWTVEGWPGYPLEMKDTAGSGVSFEARDYCEARYFYAHDMNCNPINGESSDNCLVEEFCVHSVYSTNDGATGDGIGFSLGHYNTVRKGIIAWCSDDAIDFINGNGNLVENVLAYQCGKDNTGAAVLGNGNAYKMGGSGTTVRNTIRNSIAVGTRNYAFNWNSAPAGLFENNVSIGSGARGYAARGYDSIDLRNNVSYDEIADLVDAVGGTGTMPVEEYNTWQTPPGITVVAGDFLSTTWSSAWRTWDDVVAAGYYMTNPAGQFPGNGTAGSDLGVVVP